VVIQQSPGRVPRLARYLHDEEEEVDPAPSLPGSARRLPHQLAQVGAPLSVTSAEHALQDPRRDFRLPRWQRRVCAKAVHIGLANAGDRRARQARIRTALARWRA
jgi:hypothetical protein